MFGIVLMVSSKINGMNCWFGMLNLKMGVKDWFVSFWNAWNMYMNVSKFCSH